MEVGVALAVLRTERVCENDDLSGKAGGARLLDYPETVESRHTGVSDDQLKIVRVFLHAGNGSSAVSGDFDMVPGGLQGFREHVEDKNIVVRAKHAKRLLGLHHRKVFPFEGRTLSQPRGSERVGGIMLSSGASAMCLLQQRARGGL